MSMEIRDLDGQGTLSCSCLSAVKALQRAPRPSKLCISIDKQYNLQDSGRAGRQVVCVRRLPVSLGEAKKFFILVSFCVVERPFIEEASDTASMKSSWRVLCDRVSLSAWELAMPPSKTPFLPGVFMETCIWRIECMFYAI